MAAGSSERTRSVPELRRHALRTRPAPDPLIPVQALVNTRNLLRGYDLLADAATAQEWLAAGAEGHDVPTVTPDEWAGLVTFREALRGVLLAHATGDPPDPAAVATLHAAGRQHPLPVTFDAAGAPRIEAAGPPTTPAQVAAEVLAALVSVPPDALTRLKACANPECGWVFYDTSRGRTGTWCLMSVCGARHKMARYRDRRHEPPSS
jgi:predicted RNA-binding Zn ribbon-like protein